MAPRSTQDVQVFKNKDLVLSVTSNIDPAVFNIARYGAFLDGLCTGRPYQQEAIETACNFLFGGSYRNQRDLAAENFRQNEKLREKYGEIGRFERALEFPDRLACSIDQATGTGKSFVMHGLARIALASGKVDRVLVLCPSNTIEIGLAGKFRVLSGDADLTGLLPKDSRVLNPRIINAAETITKGDICIENIHATYSRTKSAIDDSFTGKGDRTLVLCDEAHHIYSPEGDRDLKRWKEFLLDPRFGFRCIVGLSGTPYIDDEYFCDVVHRYSLRQAIEDRVVKDIDYAVQDSSADQNEKFQKIYANHKEAKAKYRKAKPLTVLVTKDIQTCKTLEDELVEFIAKKEKLPTDDAAKKVMRVHTPRSSGQGAKEDKAIALNVDQLRLGEPDRKDNPTEWIVSVSMLTEGWDAKNVFQIVPHEERAFNSKLLVAQVLGRGLRVPEEYKGEKLTVTVFNHVQWSSKIKHLVDEVLENERRVYSFPVGKTPDYDFSVHHIDYEKTEDVVKAPKPSEYNFNIECVTLAAQKKVFEKTTTYETATTGIQRDKQTRVEMEMFEIEELVADVHNRFKAIDLETGSGYAKRYPWENIRKLVRNSLDKIGYKGGEVSKENRQRILSAFGNLRRPGSKSIRYKITAKTLRTIKASSRHKDSAGLGQINRAGGATVVYDSSTLALDPEAKQVLTELENDDHLPRSSLLKVENRFNFKTCLSSVLTASDPERLFVRKLVQQENAEKVTAWLKNADSGFYGIEFSYSRGEFSRRGTFNPDFFLLLNKKDALVVEVKGDEEIGDPSPENQGKRRAAIEHFERLNELQEEKRYHFCFLTPSDYDLFFAELRDGRAMSFQGKLDVALTGGIEKSARVKADAGLTRQRPEPRKRSRSRWTRAATSGTKESLPRARSKTKR